MIVSPLNRYTMRFPTTLFCISGLTYSILHLVVAIHTHTHLAHISYHSYILLHISSRDRRGYRCNTKRVVVTVVSLWRIGDAPPAGRAGSPPTCCCTRWEKKNPAGSHRHLEHYTTPQDVYRTMFYGSILLASLFALSFAPHTTPTLFCTHFCTSYTLHTLSLFAPFVLPHTLFCTLLPRTHHIWVHTHSCTLPLFWVSKRHI